MNNISVTLNQLETNSDLLEDCINKLTLTHNQLIDLIKQLPQSALSWQPLVNTPNIGTLLLHIAYSEAFLSGQTVSQDAKQYLWDDTKPNNLSSVPNKSLNWYLDLLDTIHYHTLEKIKRLSSTSYLSINTLEGISKDYPVNWVIWHLISHKSHHQGQIELLKNWHRQAYSPVYA